MNAFHWGDGVPSGAAAGHTTHSVPGLPVEASGSFQESPGHASGRTVLGARTTHADRAVDTAYEAMLTGLRRTAAAAARAFGPTGRWVDLVRQDAEQRLGVDAGSDAVLGDPLYVAAMRRWVAVTDLYEQAQAVLDAAETGTAVVIADFQAG